MIFGWTRCLVALLLFPITGTVHSPAQAPSSASARTNTADRIAGRVVSAADGLPLSGVTVAISSPRSGQTLASMQSGEDGRFAFDGVPPGKYRLEGVKHGYLRTAYQQHGQFFTGIVTGAGLNTAFLTLQIAPTAMISGRITDEAGDPARNATVTLYEETRDTGTARVTRSRAIQTDDQGSYEMPGLMPGTYFLSVRAQPWYAVHPVRGAPSGGIDSSLDVAYPLTFYGNVTSSDEALPIPVRSGDQLNIDLQLTPQPAVRLTMPTITAGQSPPSPQLEVPVFDSFEPFAGDIQGSASGIEMVGIPPGRYRFSETDPRTGGRSAPSFLDLTRSTDAPAATDITENGGLTIHLQDARGAALPALLVVGLRSKQRDVSTASQVQQNGVVDFAGLEPGDYQLSIYGSIGLYHAARIVADGKQVRDVLHVAPGTTTSVAVEIAASTATVEGVARLSDQPAGGVMVVMVPLDRTADPELFRRDQSDLDGSFTLADVAPGRYSVVAIENGWELEWGKREVLARYLAHGLPVTITEDERQRVRLPAAVPVQPR